MNTIAEKFREKLMPRNPIRDDSEEQKAPTKPRTTRELMNQSMQNNPVIVSTRKSGASKRRNLYLAVEYDGMPKELYETFKQAWKEQEYPTLYLSKFDDDISVDEILLVIEELDAPLPGLASEQIDEVLRYSRKIVSDLGGTAYTRDVTNYDALERVIAAARSRLADAENQDTDEA